MVCCGEEENPEALENMSVFIGTNSLPCPPPPAYMVTHKPGTNATTKSDVMEFVWIGRDMNWGRFGWDDVGCDGMGEDATRK